jgi:Metal binding domain of Ada
MRTPHLLTFAVLFVIPSNPAFAQNNPVLWDINCLYVTVCTHPQFYWPVDTNVLTESRLAERVESALRHAGINLCTDINSPDGASPEKTYEKKFKGVSDLRFRHPDFPEFRLDIDLCPLKDANQFIYRVQVSFAKKLSLGENSAYYIMADVWKSEPVMRLVSKANLPDNFTETVLEQVRVFIAAKSASRPSDVNQISPQFIKSSVEINTKTEKQKNVEATFVSSKNSQVFHKASCPSAKRISPNNLVSYAARDEAIAAGKKPCERCNP